MAVARLFPLPGLEISGGKLAARAGERNVGVCSMAVTVGRKGVRPFSSNFIHRRTIVNPEFLPIVLNPLSPPFVYTSVFSEKRVY